MAEEKRFSISTVCGHCLNDGPMEIVAAYRRTVSVVEVHKHDFEDVDRISEMLKCPACRNVTIQEYTWCEVYSDPSDIEYEVVYPIKGKDEIPLGLPNHLQKAIEAANKVKNIDTNAFAVLLGRVLELVCRDRHAKGKTLNEQLQDLAIKGEIPEKLVDIARKLRELRNIGAHASLGELTQEEVPILNDLCNAILEYVYSAPYLVLQAENRIKLLNGYKGNRKIKNDTLS